MRVRFRFRSVESTNPNLPSLVLREGEPLYEPDTHRLKIGDGTTAYASLPYQAIDPTALSALVDAATAAEQGAQDAQIAAEAARDEAVAAAQAASLVPASTAGAGVVELATDTEAIAGTDDTRAVTPAALAAAMTSFSVGGGSPASETVAGILEIATTSEVTAGTDDARAVTPLKLAQALSALSYTPPPDASTTVKGLVELATSTEANTGTDTVRATTPAGVAAAIASRLPTWSNISGKPAFVGAGSTAAEARTAIGAAAEGSTGGGGISPTIIDTKGDLIVGLGADTPGRLAPAADGRLLAYDSASATGFSSVDPGLYALTTGSIQQFADVADGTPNDGDLTAFDIETNQWALIDPTTRFAQVDPSTGRLAEVSYPVDYRTLKVLNQGETVPPTTPLGSIILRRGVTGGGGGGGSTLGTTLLGTNFAQASATVMLTTTQDLAVNDWIVIAVGASNEVSPATLDHFSASSSAGAFSFSAWMPVASQGGTIAATQGRMQVGTLIPAGSVITVTAQDSAGTADARVHLMAALVKLNGVATTAPFDQSVSASGPQSSNLQSITAGPTGGSTVQASELAIGVAAWSSQVAPGDRTAVPTGSWTSVAAIKSDNGASARAMLVARQILTSVGNPKLTTSMATADGGTSTDGVTGLWAADLATFKAL